MPTKKKSQEVFVPEEEDIEADAPRSASTHDADRPSEVVLKLGEMLASRVVDHFNTMALASRLAPELCDRFASEIQIDALRTRVLELLAVKLSNDDVLVAAVASKLAELL